MDSWSKRSMNEMHGIWLWEVDSWEEGAME